MQNVVINMCEKFHFDRLGNDRALGNGKSDNITTTATRRTRTRTTFVALADPCPGRKIYYQLLWRQFPLATITQPPITWYNSVNLNSGHKDGNVTKLVRWSGRCLLKVLRVWSNHSRVHAGRLGQSQQWPREGTWTGRLQLRLRWIRSMSFVSHCRFILIIAK